MLFTAELLLEPGMMLGQRQGVALSCGPSVLATELTHVQELLRPQGWGPPHLTDWPLTPCSSVPWAQVPGRPQGTVLPFPCSHLSVKRGCVASRHLARAWGHRGALVPALQGRRAWWRRHQEDPD